MGSRGWYQQCFTNLDPSHPQPWLWWSMMVSHAILIDFDDLFRILLQPRCGYMAVLLGSDSQRKGAFRLYSQSRACRWQDARYSMFLRSNPPFDVHQSWYVWICIAITSWGSGCDYRRRGTKKLHCNLLFSTSCLLILTSKLDILSGLFILMEQKLINDYHKHMLIDREEKRVSLGLQLNLPSRAISTYLTTSRKWSQDPISSWFSHITHIWRRRKSCIHVYLREIWTQRCKKWLSHWQFMLYSSVYCVRLLLRYLSIPLKQHKDHSTTHLSWAKYLAFAWKARKRCILWQCAMTNLFIIDCFVVELRLCVGRTLDQTKKLTAAAPSADCYRKSGRIYDAHHLLPHQQLGLTEKRGMKSVRAEEHS